jgi:serine/threonine protein kinase
MDAIKLGKYTLHEQLGSGGFGTVYKAIDSMGRTVAVKVLKAGFSEEPEVIARFRREAQSAGLLYQEHIVTILDFDEIDGRRFLVMRYVDGQPLDRLIKSKGHLPWDEAVNILSDVAEGLDYAHRKGFVHRDIKPANIIVSPTEGAVLTDFGLVKAAETSGLSTSNVLLGTSSYIAPELWDGKEASPATDIYSLGCILYEMISGQVLFGGDSAAEIMKKHLINGPKFSSVWPTGVPNGIENILGEALAQEPKQRFSSAGDFVEALRKLTAPGKEPSPAIQPELVQPAKVEPAGASPKFPERTNQTNAAQLQPVELQAASQTTSKPANLEGKPPSGKRIWLIALGLLSLVGIIIIAVMFYKDRSSMAIPTVELIESAPSPVLYPTPLVEIRASPSSAKKTEFTATAPTPTSQIKFVSATFVPTRQPTPTSQVVMLTEWETIGFMKVSNGCNSSLPQPVCWRTTGNEGTLLSNIVYIDPSWKHPYLVYWQKSDGKGQFSLRVQVEQTRTLLTVYSNGDNNPGRWKEEYINISKFRGQKILLKYFEECEVVIAFTFGPVCKSGQWYLQNIQIIPDYEPTP